MSPCRFNHIILQSNEEICFKCGLRFSSKTDIITHIKNSHGNTVCHKFLQNECERSSEECLFSHQGTPIPRQDFRHLPVNPLHSPILHNVSEQNRNQDQAQLPARLTTPTQEHIIQMIPQIVSQVIVALTKQFNQ